MLVGPAGMIEKFSKEAIRFLRLFHFRGKVVLIVGGSRGLGLELARQLNKEKAKVVIAARDKNELRDAQELLDKEGLKVLTKACDITIKEEAEQLVDEVKTDLGIVDVLINCAGEIEVGPIDTMSLYDFHNAMDVHFWGPLYTMMAVIPDMRKKRAGRIVNISSLGGKVAVPHMVPYCASKHAAVGLSEGMRVELLRDNIYVTTVCPGMMRTGSHVNAKFKGNHKKEYAWFSILNALPVASVSSEKAAQEILEACKHGKAELVISLPAQIVSKVQGVFPDFVSEIMGFSNYFLPSKRTNGHDVEAIKVAKTGRQSKSAISPSAVTVLSDKAVLKNNE